MPLDPGQVTVAPDGSATGTGLTFEMYKKVEENILVKLPFEIEGDPVLVPSAEGWATVLQDYAIGIVKHFNDHFDTPTVPTTFENTVTFVDRVTLKDVVELDTHGRIRYRVRSVDDLDQFISVLDHDYVFTPATTLTAPRNWVILEDGAENGMVLKLTRRVAPLHDVNVFRADLSFIITLSPLPAGPASCELLRVNGRWELF